MVGINTDTNKYRSLADLPMHKLAEIFKIPGDNKPDIKDIEDRQNYSDYETVRKYLEEEPDVSVQTANYLKQNNQCLELLQKVTTHVQVYDSKDTALTLLKRCYSICPSFHNKKRISIANKHLTSAIRAEKWLQSKKKRRHVDQSTIKRNIDNFYEAVNEAYASLQTDSDKQNKTYFNKLKSTYQTNLPLTLPDNKSTTTVTAPVVIMVSGGINKSSHSVIKLLDDASLYLVEDASLIGINTTQNKKPFDKAQALAKRRGYTLYKAPLSRPSGNIVWYLAQTFPAYIKYASFIENLSVPNQEDEFNLLGKSSYDESINQSLKTTRLRKLRQEFENKNASIISDIKKLEIELGNLKDQRRIIGEEFSELTALSSTDNGLNIKFHKRLYTWSQHYMEKLLHEGMDIQLAKLEATRQRIEAKTLFFESEELRHKQLIIIRHLKMLKQMLDNNRQQMAENLGMVSFTKYVDDL